VGTPASCRADLVVSSVTGDKTMTIWVLEAIMTIEINEPDQHAEAAELPGIILLVALVTILTVICWFSL
jgi:hypothetical protein